ncbi:MAG: topoisomerase C-terminal repeat-containing protein, partial [Phenylobacterium sp.]
SFFNRYVEYDFTAALEEKLDQVSAGDLDWKALLREFWGEFQPATAEVLKQPTRDVIEALNTTLGPFLFPGEGGRTCPKCGSGELSLKPSRFEPFIGCSNYPECRYTRKFGPPSEDGETPAGDRELGTDPETGLTVFLKSGRFGPFVQLGEGEKPKRSSLPKGWSPEAMDLEKGLRLLRLPREVGNHPEDGGVILAGIGRYGPFVQHAGVYANLSSTEEVFEVGVNRAVNLLAEKKAGGRGGRSAAAALKELGPHPVDGAPVRILSGRFGPYVKHGDVNANVPRGEDPQALTLEAAVALLAARTAKAPAKGKARTSARAKATPAAKAKAKAAPKAKAAAKPRTATARKSSPES